MLIILFCIYVGAMGDCQIGTRTYSDGEEWVEGGIYKMRCTIGSTKYGGFHPVMLACVTSSGFEVPVGQTVVRGGAAWECNMRSADKVEGKPEIFQDCRRYPEEHASQPFGSRWTEGGYVLECGRVGRTLLRGCKRDGIFVPAERKLDREQWFFKWVCWNDGMQWRINYADQIDRIP
ncbi:hypothetical protein Q1695_003219 [Nippostrongylus brasiliensis]|nr:hypothetical protein Q1695_003219 [Nippostrongylus brasiliensis]